MRDAPPAADLIRVHNAAQDIGGYDIQKQEIREAVELPLTHSGLYQQLGIDPPRGVLLYGPPGEGSSREVWWRGDMAPQVRAPAERAIRVE